MSIFGPNFEYFSSCFHLMNKHICFSLLIRSLSSIKYRLETFAPYFVTFSLLLSSSKIYPDLIVLVYGPRLLIYVTRLVNFQHGVHTMRTKRVRRRRDVWGPLWRWIFLRIKLGTWGWAGGSLKCRHRQSLRGGEEGRERGGVCDGVVASDGHSSFSFSRTFEQFRDEKNVKTYLHVF